MGSEQSKPSSPPSPRRRSRSKEYPLSFCEFFDEYYTHRDRLYEIIHELKSIEASFENIKKKAKRGRIASITTAATGTAVGIAAAPFTGGLSLVIMGVGMTAGISGAAANLGVAVTQVTEVKEAIEMRSSLREEFVSKLQSVQVKVNQLKVCSEELRRTETCSHKNMNLFNLEISIIKLCTQIISAHQSKRTEDFTEALTGLDKLCGQIEFIF